MHKTMLALLLAASIGIMNDPAVMKSTQAHINLEKTKLAIMRLTTKNKGIEFSMPFPFSQLGLYLKVCLNCRYLRISVHISVF